jgi:large subunit ribosomal protein L17
MRHLKSGRKLGRNSAHRKAMFRNMVTSLMFHGRIRTTEAKAKELRGMADRVITLGKTMPLSTLEELNGEALDQAKAKRLHAFRRARRVINDRDALKLVFGEYSERFKDRPGGYTRIYKLGFRNGDNAPMALIELVEAMPDPDSVEDDGSVATIDADTVTEQAEE